MELPDIMGVLGLGGAGTGGYSIWQVLRNKSDIKDHKEELRETQKRLDDHKLYAANTFVKNDDLKDLKSEIKDFRQDIKDELAQLRKDLKK